MRRNRPSVLVVASVIPVLFAGGFRSLFAQNPTVDPLLTPPEREFAGKILKEYGHDVVIHRSKTTGLVRFLSVQHGKGIKLDTHKDAAPEARARRFLEVHGAIFGLRRGEEARVVRVRRRDKVGMDHVRLQQMHRGVPVTGAELVVHMKDESVTSVNGRALDAKELEGVDVSPALSAGDAQAVAKELISTAYGAVEPRLETQRLEIFNRGLIDGSRSTSRLAWFVAIHAPDVLEYAWIDARSGEVLLHFNQISGDRRREVYDAEYGGIQAPGTLVRSEGRPKTEDEDVNAAYDHMGDVYDYFWSHHGRDSIDDAGQTLIARVHYSTDVRAQWDPTNEWLDLGDGTAQGDDIVAHEVTHGLIRHTANLFNYMQSGALNESFADIFGETIDLLNGTGTDTPDALWSIGEDVPGRDILRNMMDPTRYGDPGKVSDPQFYCGGDHRGGVHHNCGVLNHAYALMVDGGTYNGYEIDGVGLENAARVMYRALTEYLSSASDFKDADYAIRQACLDIGDEDCVQVGRALDAVEMSRPWPCKTTKVKVLINGTGGGAVRRADGVSPWQYESYELDVFDGELVQLQAQPESDAIFSGWIGSCYLSKDPFCRFHASGDEIEIGAVFDLAGTTHHLQVQTSPGLRIMSPAPPTPGIDCGGGNDQCDLDVTSGDFITLNASVIEGTGVLVWDADCWYSYNNHLCYLLMNREKVARVGLYGAPADLDAIGIEFMTLPVVGERTTVVARLRNTGQAPSGMFDVKWFLDGDEVRRANHSSLAPGETSAGDITFDWTPTAGRHTLRFEVDTDRRIRESNERNNSESITVALFVDLEVRNINFSSPPAVGEPTTAIAELVNAGRAPSGQFHVKWFLDGVEVDYGSHASLEPGQMSTGNVRFDWRPTPGRHTLRFVADADRSIRESNELNNSATARVSLNPDLEVSDLTIAASADVDATATVRITNVGLTKAGPFSVRWSLNFRTAHSESFEFLDPGQAIDVRFKWTPDASHHTLSVMADADRQVRESDEFNNRAVKKISFLPDLQVGEIEFTQPPSAGMPTVATIQLANQGLTAADPFVVRWYLDHNASHPVFFTELGPGKTATVRFNWTPTAGWHRLRVMADADRKVREEIEHNNIAIVALRVGQATDLADLEASSIEFTVPPTNGVETTAVARLANVGGAASGVFNVKWFLDDVEEGYGSHASLESGQASTGNVRFNWTPTPGTHTLRFEADVDGNVREASETNNSASVTVDVQGGVLADIAVGGIEFISLPYAGLPTTAVVTLANAGQAASGVFNVKWFLNDVEVGGGSCGSLEPGQDTSIRYNWTPTPGYYALRFVADVDDQVLEMDETNNESTMLFQSEAFADLEVSGIEFSPAPEVGVKTTAIARLANVGQAPSAGFNTRWFLDGVEVINRPHAPLDTGQTSNDDSVRYEWTPTPGLHTLRFAADVDNNVNETNESNNSASVTVEVQAAGLPDLEATEISFTPPPVVGEQTTVMVRLANIGQAASGPFNVIWYLDGEEVSLGSHVSLDPGQVSNDNVRYEWTPTPDEHLLMFIADVDEQVQELDEMNNCVHVFVEPQ